jgi:hypothetical protein
MDPSGAAVSGAAIELTAADGLLRTSIADLQGHYRLNNLAPGV